MVLSIASLFVFSLAERKTNNKMKKKYRRE